MYSKNMIRMLKLTIITIVFIVTNLGVWLCLTDFNNPVSFCHYRSPGLEIALYFVAISLAFLLVKQNKQGSLLVEKWKQNKILFLFILFSLLSLFWSVRLGISTYQFFIFLSATFLASVLGLNESNAKWLERLFWFFGITVTISLGLLTAFPNAAIMAEPHLGSWRGIFWHKNFTGSLMAFGNLVFLLYGITSSKKQKGRIVFSSILYLISLVYIFFSLSAAGVAIWVALNVFVMGLLLWLRLKHLLTRKHYLSLGLIASIILVVGIFNSDMVFKLLNRTPTLTGRTPLWGYLYTNAVTENLLLGHGFSAIWAQNSFREQVTLSQKWGFTITNGHSGFMDILLNLGVVGLGFVVYLFILAFYRSWKFFVINGDISATLPLLTFIYIFLANLSISFLLEFEFFHWFLLILVLFLTTPKFEKQGAY